MKDDHPTSSSASEAEGPDYYRSRSTSAHLLESAALLGGVRGAFRYGRDQVGDFAEARAREVERLASIPRCELKNIKRICVGGEHIVHRTDDSTRIVKMTLPGGFGRTMDERCLFDPRTFQNVTKLTLRNTLPSEYLLRWALLDTLFGLQTQFEGTACDKNNEPQMVVSQPFIGEDMPDIEDIEALMHALSFVKVDSRLIAIPENADVTWYRKQDGLLITDAFPRNFRLDFASGAVIPIDLMVNVVPLGANKILPSTNAPFTLQGP